MNDSQKEAFWKHSLKMRKCWCPAFFPFFTMFSTPLRDQSHSLIHILYVLCRRFRLMSLKFYCLVIHISHKTLEIGCAWSKGSGERLRAIMALLFNNFSSPEHKVLSELLWSLTVRWCPTIHTCPNPGGSVVSMSDSWPGGYEFDPWFRPTWFLPLTSAEACEKSSRWLLKERLC